jgi:hypothetical protein
MQTLETSLLGIQFCPNGMIVCKDTSAALVFDRYGVQQVNRHLSLSRALVLLMPMNERAYLSLSGSRPPACLLYVQYSLRAAWIATPLLLFVAVRPSVCPSTGAWVETKSRVPARRVLGVVCVWIILSCLTFSRANTCPYALS